MQFMAVHANPKNLSVESNDKRTWSYSLRMLRLTATFGSCIMCSKVNSRLNHLAYRGSPHPSGGESCGVSCLCYVLACCRHICDLVQESREIELEEATPGGSALIPVYSPQHTTHRAAP